MNKLKKDAFFGVLWGSGNYIFNQVILLVVKLILVRLLIPEEFGLIAMVWVVISSLTLINAFGTGTAFIRDNESSPKRAKNTLFYLDTMAILLIAGIGFFSAPAVAAFFGKKFTDPEIVKSLVWMIRVLALSQLFQIITIVPTNMLIKKLRFKEKVIADSLGGLAYGIVAPILAFMGFGAWAIILGQIANIIIMRFVLFYNSPFFPSFIFDWKIAKKYIKFGKEAFFNSIMGVVITNGDDTLIGRMVGAAALGFYNLGQHFSGLIVSLISGVINGVMFPVLSKVQNNKELYTKAFFKGFRLTNMFTIPAIAGAVVLAREIVMLTFGIAWIGILDVFYVLSLAAFLNNLVGMASPVLNSLNKPYLMRNNKLIQFGLFIVLVYPLIKLGGNVGMSWVFVIIAIASLIHLLPILSKEIDNFYSNLFKILIKVIPSTIVMMLVVYSLKKIFPVNFISLIILVVVGMAVYFVPMLFFDEDLKWDLKEGLGVIKSKLRISK